jgi:hypothetical protein
MRYGLRTLLILLAIGPPILAAAWFEPKYIAGLVASVILCALAVLFATALATQLTDGLMAYRKNRK